MLVAQAESAAGQASALLPAVRKSRLEMEASDIASLLEAQAPEQLRPAGISAQRLPDRIDAQPFACGGVERRRSIEQRECTVDVTQIGKHQSFSHGRAGLRSQRRKSRPNLTCSLRLTGAGLYRCERGQRVDVLPTQLDRSFCFGDRFFEL